MKCQVLSVGLKTNHLIWLNVKTSVLTPVLSGTGQRVPPWWRHQMETFSALLAICAGNSPIPGEFPAQRPVTPCFNVYFDLRLNKRLNKQSWGWWFEALSCPLWHQRNAKTIFTQDNSYPGKLVHKTARTQDSSYPRQLVPSLET